MNKKGTHVDWAVSMGIFLVYVLSMFVLIQPGVEQFYKEDNLLGIVEKGLTSPNPALGGAYYSITKLPVRIDILENPNCPTGKHVSIENPFGVDITNTDLRIFMLNELGEEDNLKIFIADEGTIKFKPIAPLPRDDNPHFMEIYYSPDAFKPPEFALPRTNIGPLCEAADTTLGSIEHITGLDPDMLGDAFDCKTREQYENLKKLWKFPTGKEFSLYYADTEELPYTTEDITPLCNYGTGAFITPYDQSDVYVKEWNDWLLEPTGELVPVIINARVW